MTPVPVSKTFLPTLMKLFQQKPDAVPLGPLLRQARMDRKLSLEEAAHAAHLSEQEIERLENDQPLDSRRARIQTVSYLRFLGMNPTEFKDSLPDLPNLMTSPRRVVVRRENPLWQGGESLLAMLAPMGKLALSLLLLVTLLSSWGMVRQLSRVRSMPWVSSTYYIHDTTTR
jgi:transcriptional regulator with XRE-family HTH domain